MKKIKGIQDVVYEAMKSLYDSGELVISKKQIKAKIMNTKKAKKVAGLEEKQYKNDKVSKLDRALNQALFHLKKNNMIESTNHGVWTLIRTEQPKKTRHTHYTPDPCHALIPEYLYDCSRCGYKEREKSMTTLEKKRCPECKKVLTPMLFQYYCPVKRTYIGKPTAQCELLHSTDYVKMETMIEPMKVCYFAKSPTSLSLRHAKRKIERYEERLKQLMMPTNHGF